MIVQSARSVVSFSNFWTKNCQTAYSCFNDTFTSFMVILSVWIAGGVEGLNPQMFFQPPNTLSEGESAILYTYELHHNFGRAPTVKKFNPQLIFYNSITGYSTPFLFQLRARAGQRQTDWRTYGNVTQLMPVTDHMVQNQSQSSAAPFNLLRIYALNTRNFVNYNDSFNVSSVHSTRNTSRHYSTIHSRQWSIAYNPRCRSFDQLDFTRV